MDGEETVKAAMISTEIRTEWKTFRQLLVKQPQDTTASQLKELVSNDMLKAMFPNLNKIVSIGLTIPVSTASVERSFSQMKMIKTRLRNGPVARKNERIQSPVIGPDVISGLP